jgi:hypothetical protein
MFNPEERTFWVLAGAVIGKTDIKRSHATWEAQIRRIMV